MARASAGRIVVILLALVPARVPAQEELPPLAKRERLPLFVSVLSPLIVPKIFADCYQLREYVCSDELAVARKAYGDLYAVDLIFDRAMRLCWNNRGEALLVSAFAVMDHRRFGVRIPLLGAFIWIPLSSEFPEEFRRRIRALPGRLYPDTPPEGDRDKLQHFFGSAFLTVLAGSPDAADRFGLFIEWGEDRFIVGGVNDPRDVRANRQGQRFAERLMEDEDARPSDVFLEEFRPGADTLSVPSDTLKSLEEQ
ncbi:MAG TPA: hypothetical protein VEO56_10850 [Bacteroidota bacterium]|nr:hypothetical protein [Bacteroidota bacterium]